MGEFDLAIRGMRVGLTEMLEPEAKTGNTNLATGTNCEKARCNRGGAMLAKRLKTGAAPKGAARRETQYPMDNRLRR